MIDGTYRTTVNTPLGKKAVTVTIATRGGLADFTVEVPGFGKKRAQGVVEGDTFAAQGSVKIPFVGQLDVVVDGIVEGDVLSATAVTNKGTKQFTAYRV